jgi:hypothetical protein
VQTELQRYWWRVLQRPEVGCSHTALWHQTFSTHWDTCVITIKLANILTLNAGHLFHQSNIIYFSKIPKHIYALSDLGTSFKKSATIRNQSQTDIYQFLVITEPTAPRILLRRPKQISTVTQPHTGHDGNKSYSQSFRREVPDRPPYCSGELFMKLSASLLESHTGLLGRRNVHTEVLSLSLNSL